MMKTEFTKPEIDQLLELIKLRQDANRSEQKLIRNSMRKIGFYGRNCFGITDMNVEKFNSLITKGLIRVKDECHNHNSMQHNVFADDSLDTFSFAPLIDKDSEVLILGTVPGELSIRKNEYYASPNNRFWKVISALCNDNVLFASYNDKKECLRRNRIALWDVYHSCSREGSEDRNIRSAINNDIDLLLKKYSNIRKIIFNGKKASDVYYPKLESYVCISTANHFKKNEDLICSWKRALALD